VRPRCSIVRTRSAKLGSGISSLPGAFCMAPRYPTGGGRARDGDGRGTGSCGRRSTALGSSIVDRRFAILDDDRLR